MAKKKSKKDSSYGIWDGVKYGLGAAIGIYPDIDIPNEEVEMRRMGKRMGEVGKRAAQMRKTGKGASQIRKGAQRVGDSIKTYSKGGYVEGK